jgi:hypothetical protein
MRRKIAELVKKFSNCLTDYVNVFCKSCILAHYFTLLISIGTVIYEYYELWFRSKL